MDYGELNAQMLEARAKKQAREIETISERTFTLKLSDADVDRLAQKAAAGGMTMGELLASFVGDLVDGTYSNGSDERMYAQEWYDRCGFTMCQTGNISKLSAIGELGNIADVWDRYVDDLDELNDLVKDYENPDLDDVREEDVKNAEDYVADDRADLLRIMEDAGCDDSMEVVIAEVTAWFADANKIKGRKVNLDVY